MTRRPYLVLVIAMLALAALACNLSGNAPQPEQQAQPDTSGAPSVDIRVPVNGMSFAEGTNVIIQVVGTDSGSGVSRIDLLIDDVVVSSSEAPTTTGQPAYMVNFEWPAQGVGAHSISAVALRQDGASSTPAIISVNVVAVQPTAAPTATPEPTTEEPEATEEPEETEAPEPTAAPTGPRAVTTSGVNVRSGPSTNYSLIGSLLAGTELDVTGRNADSTWFRVPYYNAEGWIFGGLLTVTGDVNSLPVINVPPPPPTAAPPPTAIPATNAPPVPSTPTFSFWSTNPSTPVAPGTPIRFYWESSGIKAIYFQGDPVTGSNPGGVERVVNSTTTFTLRVVYPDDSVHEQSITVNVQ